MLGQQEAQVAQHRPGGQGQERLCASAIHAWLARELLFELTLAALLGARHALHRAPAPANPARRRAKLGQAPDPAPRWLGNLLAWVLTRLGPRGLEFAKYSIDYHYLR